MCLMDSVVSLPSPDQAQVPRPRVAEILRSIVDDSGGRTTLPDRLCRECVAALSVSEVGLALMSAEGPNGSIVVASASAARGLEELQFTLGEGPGVDASRNGRPVLEPDLLETPTTRWPGFGLAAVAAGFRAIFAFPLQVGAIRLGALDLYRDTPGSLSPAELGDAWAFADAATLMLLNLQGDDTGSTHPALMAAFDDRAQVHQATGMISVQLDVSLADALLRLRAHAYAAERSILDVAADVVCRRMRFDNSEKGSSTADRSWPVEER